MCNAVKYSYPCVLQMMVALNKDRTVVVIHDGMRYKYAIYKLSFVHGICIH